jgi:hypothetical protein
MVSVVDIRPGREPRFDGDRRTPYLSRMMRRQLAFLTLLLLPAASTCGPATASADLILLGGKIVTLGPEPEPVEALAVAEGRILAIGSDDDVLALGGPDTRVIDLAGRTVVPGLADNHFHGLGGGPGVDLSSARSLVDVEAAIRVRAAETPPGEVIVTNSNWHEGQLAEQRLPLRDDLDRATDEHPVVVVRGGHEYVLNSAALEHWGIGPETETPAGGRVGRYGDGRLNGELVDRAQDLVSLPPGPPPPDPAEALIEDLAVLGGLGITSIRVPGGSSEQYRLFHRLADEGRLNVRVDFLFRPRGVGPDAIESTVASWGVGPNDRTELISVGGVKLGVDGGFEGGWMREPYQEPWGEEGTYFGLRTMDPDVYRAVVVRLGELGWRVATHAVGDAAVDLVLDAYGEANRTRSIVGRRWTIEHGFIPAPDQFERMRDLGLTVTAQNHLYVAAPSLVQYWGADRAALTTPVGRYVEERVPVSLGTDSPVIPYNPFWVLYHFVTRGTLSAGVMGPEHAVDRLEALRLMTAGFAYQTFDEERRGKLLPGMQADLAVLSGDYLTVPEEAIQDLRSELTVVGGRIVFEREGG